MHAKIIDFSTIRTGSRERERKERVRALTRLLLEDVEAYHQLREYSLDCRKKVSPRVENLLIQRGILNPDGSLPDLTNEAIFEARTGEKPFWLPDHLASRYMP